MLICRRGAEERSRAVLITHNEKDHRSDRWSQKPNGFCLALPCQVAADRLAGCRGVDARFTLAVRTPAFGPFAFRTLVPSDACHHRHWSLSALVTVGAGSCEKPLDQPNGPTLDETAGSSIFCQARALGCVTWFVNVICPLGQWPQGQ